MAFENVPSFVYKRDLSVSVPGIGEVPYDVAFGGAFYAYCKAEDLGVRVVPEEFRGLIEVGMSVKSAVMDSLEIKHPSKTTSVSCTGRLSTTRTLEMALTAATYASSLKAKSIVHLPDRCQRAYCARTREGKVGSRRAVCD